MKRELSNFDLCSVKSIKNLTETLVVSIWLSIHVNTMWSMCCMCVCVFQQSTGRVKRLFSSFFFPYQAFMSLWGMFIERRPVSLVFPESPHIVVCFSWLIDGERGAGSRTERQETSVPGSNSGDWCAKRWHLSGSKPRVYTALKHLILRSFFS